MWLADDAAPEVRELTEAMTLRSYEQQLPWKDRCGLSGRSVRRTHGSARSARRRSSSSARRMSTTSRSMAERLAAEIPAATLETIEGAGHLPSLERPDELNRLLLDFLR